ncbi:response regulator [Paraglaciecola aquimarina]|uniref:histidine kinase n=1 Tax=Paraglaciecola aquimarina TaxID=1235557 RepID=A0ABU3SV67_9ALTE|nr:response regulator [Paraglaciecola aquimarina]MDU0353911.1 response regulator [Paraglaciecola aquimarina]
MKTSTFTKRLKFAVRCSFFVFCLSSPHIYAGYDENLTEELKELSAHLQSNSSAATAKIEYFTSHFASHPDDYYESTFLNLLAYKSLLALDLKDTYEKLLAARLKASNTKNMLQIAESYRLEGAVLDIIGEYGRALAALNKSFEIFDELQSPEVLRVYSSLINVYTSLNDYQSILHNAYLLLSAAQKYENTTHEGLAYFRIAFAQSKLNQMQDAIVNTAISEKILEQADFPFIGVLYLLIAQINVAQGDVEGGLKRISQSIKADRKIDYLQNEVPRLLLRADIYQLQDNINAAVAELEKSLESEPLKKDKIQYLQILEKLIELSDKTGNSDSELKFLKQYNAMYKQSFNQKQAQLLAINNVRLEVFEKNKAIKLLQKENELQLQKSLIQNQHNLYQLYFTLTVFAALLLVIVLLIRTRKQRAQLNRNAQELKLATQAKSDFLARMSHEIRTPINAISGLTKLMQRSAESNEDITNLQQIDEASNSLLGVINDILDFSKIEAGKLDIETTSFQLDKIVSQSIRLQSIRAQQKNIELIQHIARDVPIHLQGDELRIQQVLVNLLSNAVKFTEQGLVSVTVKNKVIGQTEFLEFAVKDTGIGLSQSQIDGLFKSFAQVDESISRKYGGTGLGLTICKQLVELMGGNIWVESQIGTGSTFYFTWPTKEDKNQYNEPLSEQLSKLRVLVADDVNLSRQVIAESLLEANITPDLANGGQETLNKLRLAASKHNPYDVLILDWKMPDIDGLQVTAIINQEFNTNKPKIIMLSAFDFAHMQQQANHLGIKGFIEKPFSANQLLNKLQEVALNVTPKPPAQLSALKNVPDLSNKRILLAEDNKLNQKVALGFLKFTNAQVVLVENGLEVVNAVKSQGYFDCILMDIQMPEMDGFTATSILHDDLGFTQPIIAMTANAMKKDIEKSTAMGMTAYITKPIDPEYFYQVLKEILLTTAKACTPDAAILQENNKQQTNLLPIDALLIMDQQLAMQKLFIDEETYASLLKDFVEKESAIKNLTTLIEHSNYQNIYKLTHDTLPALTYIGAYNLAKLAKSVETVIYNNKQENNLDFIEQLTLFDRAMLELIEKIKQQLASD